MPCSVAAGVVAVWVVLGGARVGLAVGQELGDAVEGLVEVFGEGVGEVLPPGAPEGVGGAHAVAEVGVEGAVAGDEGDAAPAVELVGEALDAALAEVAAVDEGADGVVGDAECWAISGIRLWGKSVSTGRWRWWRRGLSISTVWGWRWAGASSGIMAVRGGEAAVVARRAMAHSPGARRRAVWRRARRARSSSGWESRWGLSLSQAARKTSPKSIMRGSVRIVLG